MLARKKAQKIKRAVTTPDRILDVAERLMQTRGYNSFSYADVAAEIGITKAGLYHHFGSKAKLGHAVTERYAGRVFAAAGAIDASGLDASLRLERYTQVYAGVLSQGRLCLVGMLAAEFNTLPEPMQETIRQYISGSERWLAALIGQGRAAGKLFPIGTDREAALLLIGALEGAMLIAGPMNDKAGFNSSVRQLLATLRRKP